jgi:hypothetical protein
MVMQRAVTPPSSDLWGFDSLPTHGIAMMRRKFQWRNARLQIGKRQVRSLPGVRVIDHVTERPGAGLQSPTHRFDSCRGLWGRSSTGQSAGMWPRWL